jgi:SRSO17 transposase
MQDNIPANMPKFFESWCSKFDDIFNREAQRQGFRHYLAGILGKSDRKNVQAMANDTVDGNYHNLHHFLHDAPWKADELNNRRLDIVAQCRQTRIKSGFTLIIDDSGHRKSGIHTAGVGRQYIGQFGKVDNGVVMVTSHAFDGVKGFPLDVELYKHASSLPQGKEDPEFSKKPNLALKLVDGCLGRALTPGLILLDAGYGNNGPLLQSLEERKLTYIAAISSSRVVWIEQEGDSRAEKHRLEDVAKALKEDAFVPVVLPLEKPRTVWVAVFRAGMPKFNGRRVFAVQLNAPSISEATEIDYFITNAATDVATPEWVAQSYSQRNWVEVFYREAKGWLGITEYQVRSEASIKRHWTLVFTAFTFIHWLRLTGGLSKWTTKPLLTFNDAYKAYRAAVDYLAVQFAAMCPSVMSAHRSRLGLVWA